MLYEKFSTTFGLFEKPTDALANESGSFDMDWTGGQLGAQVLNRISGFVYRCARRDRWCDRSYSPGPKLTLVATSVSCPDARRNECAQAVSMCRHAVTGAAIARPRRAVAPRSP